MIFPPSIMRLRIVNQQRRFSVWLPLLPLWLLALTIGVLLSPLVLILALLLWPFGWGKALLLTGPWLFRVFCALRGLSISVDEPSEEVYIYFA